MIVVVPIGTGSSAAAASYDAAIVTPDGTKVAYATAGGLYVAPAHSPNGVYITDYTGPFSWSPDDVHLVMVGPDGLSIVDTLAFTSQLLPGTRGARSPQWSPDGTLISAWLSGAQLLIAPDGSSRVTRNNPHSGPWSPDGRYMLNTDPVPGSTGVSTCLCVYDAVTGALARRWALPTAYSWLQNSWAAPVSWGSSDGTNVVFYLEVPAYRDQTQIVRVAARTNDPNSAVITPTTGSVQIGGAGLPVDTNGAPPAVTALTAHPSPSRVSIAWIASSAKDAAGVTVRYSLGTVPPATVTDGLDGGRLLTTTRTLGPFPPDRPIAISVFSRDWAGNIGPPATVVATTPHQSSVILTARPSSIDLQMNATAFVGLRLVREFDHVPVANAKIAVATRRWNTLDPFVVKAYVFTDANGNVTIRQVNSISKDYRFTSVGDATHAAATATARIRVWPGVRRNLYSTQRGVPGTIVRLTATTVPAFPNTRTYLQAYTDHWFDVGPHNTDAAGAVTFQLRIPPKGFSVTYRVRVSPGGSYLDGFSDRVTLVGI